MYFCVVGVGMEWFVGIGVLKVVVDCLGIFEVYVGLVVVFVNMYGGLG